MAFHKVFRPGMSPNLDSDSSKATGGGLELGFSNRGESKPNDGMAPKASRLEHHPAWARYAVALVAVALGWLAREALKRAQQLEISPWRPAKAGQLRTETGLPASHSISMI